MGLARSSPPDHHLLFLSPGLQAMSVRRSSSFPLCRAHCGTSQNLDVPMEDDVLSDVVPSNIVSRQVSISVHPHAREAELVCNTGERRCGERV